MVSQKTYAGRFYTAYPGGLSLFGEEITDWENALGLSLVIEADPDVSSLVAQHIADLHAEGNFPPLSWGEALDAALHVALNAGLVVKNVVVTHDVALALYELEWLTLADFENAYEEDDLIAVPISWQAGVHTSENEDNGQPRFELTLWIEQAPDGEKPQRVFLQDEESLPLLQLSIRSPERPYRKTEDDFALDEEADNDETFDDDFDDEVTDEENT